MVFYKKDLFSGEVWWIMFSNSIIILRLSHKVCWCSYMLLLVVSLVRPLFKAYGFPILTQVIKGYHWKLSLNKWQCCWQSNCCYFLFVVTDFTSTPSPSTFPAKMFIKARYRVNCKSYFWWPSQNRFTRGFWIYLSTVFFPIGSSYRYNMP